MDRYQRLRYYAGRMTQNWLFSGVLIGMAGAALKSLLDSAFVRIGFSNLRNSEVSRRAVFGKPQLSPRAIMNPRKAGLKRNFGAVATQTILGALAGTGIAAVTAGRRPQRGLLTGAIMGAGVGLLTLGVAGIRRTGVFQRNALRTAGSVILTNSIVGALSGLTLSGVGKMSGFPRMIANVPNVHQQPDAKEEIPTFVH